jgi:hypothetical protein
MHAMKEWLRQNPQHVPDGLDPTTSTSQQLRVALRRRGWNLQETGTEFRLIPPDTPFSGAIGEILDEPEVLSEEGEEDAYFGLESQLRDFLAQNLTTIPVNGQRLRVYVDPAGRDGVEFSTAVGFIDILAVDDHGNFYVFELKRGRTPDHTIGQLMRYMGWVNQTIGKGVNVNGVIVAKEISDNLKYSVLIVPNVSLLEYEISFQLHTASAIGVT